MKFLNLGCGSRYLENWTNLDFVKTGSNVIAHNLLERTAFGDNDFDVVYHSHVLEHFSKEDGKKFINECYRILKPGGVIRIAVPDLETIAKEYLLNLDKAVNGDTEAVNNYEWIILEMYDQVMRKRTGGEMLKYWQQPVIENEAYITNRLGNEFTSARKRIKEENQVWNGEEPINNTFKDKIIRWLTGDKLAPEHLKAGKFRASGEIHQWMYDRFSLSRLLNQTGFQNVQQMNAFTSMIPDWPINQWLDVEDGKTRKPDSLFIEAKK